MHHLHEMDSAERMLCRHCLDHYERLVPQMLEAARLYCRAYDGGFLNDKAAHGLRQAFGKLLAKVQNTMIVGDDLTITSPKRLEKAIEEKSINAIIVKPNQNGSLLEVRNVCELAKKHGIKIVFSHRSGETTETILADLAFGFQADFLKCGITGKEREAKIKRLIEIEKKMK